MPAHAQPPARQGNLFAQGDNAGSQIEAVLALDAPQLHQWQRRLSQFQQPQFQAAAGAAQPNTGIKTLPAPAAGTEAPAGDPGPASGQGSLFSAAGVATPGGPNREPLALAASLDPLALVAQPLQFWRWPGAPQQGAALYFVVDRPSHLASPLLLYVGETGQADRRWKGEHDCKDYLAAYGEALLQVGLDCQLSIRFWSDAPTPTRQRRALEQALIRLWQPPFNKETRGRWATPFTT